jgi:hypothetical protein
MQARKIVLKTTYTVVGGTEEEAQKACCMVAAGITRSWKLPCPCAIGNVAVEPNISQIVECEDASDYSDGLKSVVKLIEEEQACE